MGCDVIDKIFNRGFEEGYKQGFEKGYKQGFEEGYKQGMEQMLLLLRKLLAQNRIEDIKKVCSDKEYRMQLLKEFGIVQDACTRSPSSSSPKTS